MNWIEKNLELISWAPTILFLVIVIIYVLRGMLRGFRKSTILFINCLIAMLLTFLIFTFVLTADNVQTKLISLINSIIPSSIQEILGVSVDAKTVLEIGSEFIVAKVTSLKPATVEVLTPYVMVFAKATLGIIFFLLSLIIYQFFKGILYIVYLIFFKEKRRRKKIKKDFEEGNRTTDYKKRRLLGGLIGGIKGIIFTSMFFGFFGSIIYAATGDIKRNLKADEEMKLIVNNQEEDLTVYYNLIDGYKNTGITGLLEGMKGKNSAPFYAAYMNLFIKGDLKVKEDGIDTTIYPIEEIASITEVVHKMVKLCSKYQIDIQSSTLASDLSNLVSANDDFSNELLAIIKSIDKTNLKTALGKSINIHLISLIKAQGIENKYINMLFLGDNAITLADLVSKDDLDLFFDIGKLALKLYSKHQEGSTPVKLAVEQTEDIVTLLDTVLELSLFKNNASKLNPLISDLMGVAVGNVEILKGADFSNINWLTVNDSTVSSEGEINKFIKAFEQFISCEFFTTNETNKLEYNFENIEKLWQKDSISNKSAMDYVSESLALRRVASYSLTTIKIGTTNLYIPSSACDSGTNIITASEYSKLFTCLGELIKRSELKGYKLDKANLVNSLLPYLLNVFNDDDSFDVVFDSKVLESMMSKVMYDTLSSNEYFKNITSDLVLDTANVSKNIDNWVGEDGELRKVLRGTALLLQKEIIKISTSEITYDLSHLSSITIADEVGNVPSDKLVDSVLIRTMFPALMDKQLNQFITYVPQDSYDSSYTEVKVLSKEEMKNMLNSLSVLEGVNLTSPTIQDDILDVVFDSLKDESKTDKLFKSKIIESSVSIKLYELLIANNLTKTSVNASLVLDSENVSTNINNWVGSNGELRKFINSLNEVMDAGLLTINLKNEQAFSYDVSKIGNLFTNEPVTEPIIDAVGLENEDLPVDRVLNSTILHGVTSNILLEVNIGYTLYIPDTVKTDSIINKDELKRALYSASLIIKDVNLEATDVADKVMANVKTISSTDSGVDELLASIIIEGTLVNAIWNNLKDNGTVKPSIPVYLKIDDADENFNNWTGINGELRKLMRAFKLVDVNNLNDVNFIFDSKEEDIDLLTKSDILAYVITDNIKGVSNESITIYILDECYEIEKRHELSDKYAISSNEIYRLLSSIKELLYDPTNPDKKVDINKIDFDISKTLGDSEKLDIVLNSKIIETSLSYKVYDLLKGKVKIQTELSLSEINLTSSSNVYRWINDENQIVGELRNLINALNSLGLVDSIDSATGVEIKTSDILGDLTDENLLNSLESNIIWLTLSDVIIDSIKDISSYSYDNNFSTDIEKYLRIDEIINLKISIDALGLESMDNITPDLILGKELNFDIILNSYVIWYKFSKFISDTDLTIPSAAYQEMNKILIPDGYEVVIEEKYLSKQEIKALANSLDIIGISNFDNTSEINSNNLLSLEDAKIDGLLESFIIWYKFSTSIQTTSLDIPNAAYDNSSTLEEQYLSKEEIKALVNSLDIIGISDFDNTSEINSNSLLSLDNAKIQGLLESNIIWYKMSDILLGNNALVIVNDLRLENGEETAKYIDKDEIQNLVSAFKAIGSNFDVTEVQIDPSNLEESQIESITQSVILRGTVSKIIFTDSKVKTIEDSITKEMSGQIDILLVTENELKYLLTSLRTMGINNIANFSSSVNLTKILSLNSNDRASVLDSNTIWLMVSNLIPNIGGKLTTIEKQVVSIDNNVIESVVKDLITKDAIINLI